MSIEGNKGKEAVAGLVDSMKEYSNEKVTFVNTTDLLEALEYIRKLEVDGLKEIDNVSDLKVGDAVETLINYTFTNKGTRGTIDRIDDTEYPFRVRFEGEKYPVGYRRFELGKVSS